MYSCKACGDTYCDGCDDYERTEPVDPVLLSLMEYQPVEEPMTLEAWEEREAVEAWQALEDKRAKAAASLAWANKARENRRIAA